MMADDSEGRFPTQDQKMSVAGLPNELLLHIWSFLECWESEPPSVNKINEEPSFHLTSNDDQDLKSLSLVCKRWRALVLPELFKFSRVILDDTPRWIQLSYWLVASIKDVTRNLSAHERSVYERLRGYFESCANTSPGSRNPTAFVDIEEMYEDDRVFNSLPDSFRCWMPSSASTLPFLNFIKVNKLERKVHGLVILSEKAYSETPSEPLINKMNAEHETFWKDILNVINPVRIVIAVPPSTMAALTDGKLHTADTWAFGQDIHILELRQNTPEARDTSIFEDDTGTTFNYHKCLHNMRRWVHLSYNEGSFLPAYNTYEFFNKRPPYILYYLLKWLHKEAKYTPPKLESVSYRGIFPYSSHIFNIMSALHSVDEIHSLKHLQLSFAPDPQSSILDDPQRVGRADLNDCWSEFERSYAEAIKYVARPRLKPGLRITCHDYMNETREKVLDEKFAVLKPLGWIREGNSWIKPEPDRSMLDEDEADE